jgi:thioredoxin 2
MATTTGTTRHLTLRCQFCGSWNRVDAARAQDRPKCGNCGKPMLLDRPVKLDDDSFARTIESAEVPVLVDFYADWCAPCKIMAPAVDELARKYTGRLLVAKVDTEVAQQVAAQHDIRALPTVVVFEAGKELTRQAGAIPLAALEQLVPASAKAAA